MACNDFSRRSKKTAKEAMCDLSSNMDSNDLTFEDELIPIVRMTGKAPFSSSIQKQCGIHTDSDKDYIPSDVNDTPTTGPVNPTEDDNRLNASNVDMTDVDHADESNNNDEGRPGTSRGTRWRKSNLNRHKCKSIKADRNHGKAYTSHSNKSYEAKKPKEMLNHKHDKKSGYQCSKAVFNTGTSVVKITSKSYHQPHKGKLLGKSVYGVGPITCIAFKIIFQATAGAEGRGDIAIDDIALYSSKCSKKLDPKNLIPV
uniref:MAM domain-containing protein n=1 Tax=Romanomermis culicivorax TaxID=13658 RepID=A0A915J1L5_ROMCU